MPNGAGTVDPRDPAGDEADTDHRVEVAGGHPLEVEPVEPAGPGGGRPRRRAPRRPRPTGHQLRRLTGPSRWLVLATLLLAGLGPCLAAANALRQGWQPTGDVAIIGIRSLDAWTGNAPLLGQPSSAEELTGVRTWHPGPSEYWWTGPWIRLLGPRVGLVVAAALVNGAALAGAAWLAFRRGGPVLLALTAVVLALLVHGLGAVSLYDPFNSELATFPMVLAVLATWSVLAGDVRVLPVLAASATVAAHTHVATAGFVAPLAVLAAGSLALQVRSDRRLLRRHRTPLLGGLAVVVVGWLPVLAQELTGGPSNLHALARYATTPHPRIGLAFTAERLAGAVGLPPLFVRSSGRFGFLDDPGTLGVLVAALCGAAWASFALLARIRADRRDPLRLAVVLAAVTLVSLVTGAGLQPLTAFRADGTRWLWVVSALLWLSTAWSGWQLLPDRVRRRATRGAAPVAVAALALGLGLAVSIASDDLPRQRDGGLMAASAEVGAATLRAVPEGRYLVTYDGPQALVTLGPGLAFRLEDAGRHVLVEASPFDRGYGTERVYAGQPIDGTLRVFTGTAPAIRPGETLLVEVPLSAANPERGVVAVYRS